MFAIVSLFADKPKIIKRGENSYSSGHVTSFTFDSLHIKCRVLASQKDKTYDVQVGLRGQ